MKTGCRVCGIHFGDEFDKTLIPPCNYWGDMGMSNFPQDLRKKIWDWQFACPSDEVYVKYKMQLALSISMVHVEEQNRFENIVKEWGSMTEEEKRSFQRAWFKDRFNRGEK